MVIPPAYTLAHTCVGFAASNTSSDTEQYVTCQTNLTMGLTYTMSVCRQWDSSFSGDTYLRLVDVSSGQQVASNDDGVCSPGSTIVFTASSSGSFKVHQGYCVRLGVSFLLSFTTRR